MRIDKWLWAARFYKTRSLAAQELDKGRVQLNGHAVKPAHEIKPGDKLMLRQGTVLREVQVPVQRPVSCCVKRSTLPATLLPAQKRFPR